MNQADLTEDEIRSMPWVNDEYGYAHFIIPGKLWIHIQPRPHYCDRGHYLVEVVHGIPSLDDADHRPNYYMSLGSAKQETIDWLVWRFCKKSEYSVELAKFKMEKANMTYDQIKECFNRERTTQV